MLRSYCSGPVISNAEGGALGRNKCPLCGPTVCLRSMPYFPRQPGLYSVSALTVVCRLCSTVSALDLCSRYPVWCSVCTVSVPDCVHT